MYDDNSIENTLDDTILIDDEEEAGYNSFTVENTFTGSQITKTTQLNKTKNLIELEGRKPSKSWLKCLNYLSHNQVDEAYREILNSSDDLYLLRLMIKTGPGCYSKLKPLTSSILFKRIVKISKANFLDDIVMDYFLECCESGMVSYLDREVKESMVMVLETMTNSGNHNKVVNILLAFLRHNINNKKY